MPRNKQFGSGGRLAPFARDGNVELQHQSIHGPLPFFNPTTALFRVKADNTADPTSDNSIMPAEGQAAPQGVLVRWRARDNRKGRHTLVVHPSIGVQAPSSTKSLKAVSRGIVRMATFCPYWDVSYLVAVFFTVGCLIFIACGLLSWLPIAYPGSTFEGESSMAGGVTAFVWATLFQIGAVLLVFEACNENQTGCFGWAIHNALSSNELSPKIDQEHHFLIEADSQNCKHHHQTGFSQLSPIQTRPDRSWEWLPSWSELRNHYIHEIGFMASTSLALGATIFYVSGICALPGLYDKLSLGVIQGVYLFTYLFGGVIFIFSSVLYVLENQINWYTPAPQLIGWHIGVWNLIGSIGWTLAASFGYCITDWCGYQSELTLLWASVAFFIGSALLWYEALDKYPVEISSVD